MLKIKYIKILGLSASIVNFLISLAVYLLYDFNTNQYQFVEEQYELKYFDIYLGIDGISIYFVLLTTFLTPIALLSNYNTINNNLKYFLISFLIFY